MKTHKDITDPELRAILANELIIFRLIKKRGQTSGDYLLGLRVGFITALRRVQFVRNINASGGGV